MYVSQYDGTRSQASPVHQFHQFVLIIIHRSGKVYYIKEKMAEAWEEKANDNKYFSSIYYSVFTLQLFEIY